MKLAFLPSEYKGELKILCAELEISNEMERLLLQAWDTLEPDLAEPVLQAVFSDIPFDAAARRVQAFCEKQGPMHALRGLAVYLLAALHTKEIYRRRGIPDGIYTDTIKALVRFTREDTQRAGQITFQRFAWSCRHLRASIFRLGALEYEMRILTDTEPPVGGAAAGDAALSVHIPSDAAFLPHALRKSYKLAGRFFRQYFPVFDFRCVYCDSWLLSPVLKDILRPESKILQFQSDYVIEHVDCGDNSGMIWAFQMETDTYEELPADNALRQGLKNRLLSGGAIGSARGYVRSDVFERC